MAQVRSEKIIRLQEEETRSVADLSTVCSHIVVTCLYWPRLDRPDILLSVNKLARAVTKCTKACDKAILLWDTFQDSDFAGDLEDSKSTSGRILCIFGSGTFVPISWTCKKQTSVSHCSTEAEIISLDAGLRMEGIHALDLWDLVIQTKKQNQRC